jgi:hypothetical protein
VARGYVQTFEASKGAMSKPSAPRPPAAKGRKGK